MRLLPSCGPRLTSCSGPRCPGTRCWRPHMATVMYGRRGRRTGQVPAGPAVTGWCSGRGGEPRSIWLVGGGGRGVGGGGGGGATIDLASGVRWQRLTPGADDRVDFLEVIYEPSGHS